MKRVKLPAPVAQIYAAVDALESEYPGRKFTSDGHLVGSIGEVIAAKAFGLTLRTIRPMATTQTIKTTGQSR